MILKILQTTVQIKSMGAGIKVLNLCSVYSITEKFSFLQYFSTSFVYNSVKDLMNCCIIYTTCMYVCTINDFISLILGDIHTSIPKSFIDIVYSITTLKITFFLFRFNQ